MNINMEPVFERKSVRNFDPRPLAEDVVRYLKAEISDIVTHEAGMHFQLFTEDPNPFKNFKDSYGMFHNARNYIACVVDSSFDYVWQRAGFCAQRLVLGAVSKGLGTCFVSGTYSKNSVKAQLRADWKLPFIIVLGYPAKDKDSTFVSALMKSFMKKSPENISSILLPESVDSKQIGQLSPQYIKGLEAVLAAPSAMNRHPARMKFLNGKDGLIVEACTENNSQIGNIDLGIAMYNWQTQVPGVWDFGNPAVFYPDIS